MAEEVIKRGKRAEEILNDPLINMILTDIRERQFQAIEASGPNDASKREHAYAMLKVLEEFRIQLNTHRNNGVFEQNIVDKQQRR
jgi:hypothetical protein